MDQISSKDGLNNFPNEFPPSPSSLNTRSDGFAPNVDDEWPSSRALAQRCGRYDAQGFLVDFEYTTAYTLPRKAPLRPPCDSQVSSLSRTNTNRVEHSSSASEPLIVVPYESTSEADDPTPSTPQIRFSNAYRKWWLEQYSRSKPMVQLVAKRPPRANRQGFWLARGTLRGADKVMEQQGPGYWLARRTGKDPGHCESAERPHRLWKRVTSKMRSISTEEK